MSGQTARLLDHRGEWTEPFPVGTVTCRGGDALWDHRLFAGEPERRQLLARIARLLRAAGSLRRQA